MKAQTFENRINPRSFWSAVVFPPLGFWLILISIAGPRFDDHVGLAELYLLVGLAYAIPLGALTWTLCSVCAASVSERGLTIHRVVADREWPLASIENVEMAADDSIRVRVANAQLHLRPDDPERFIAQLTEARAAASIHA